MNQEERKLEKLKQIIEIADQDFVTTEDFVQVIDILIAAVHGAVDGNTKNADEFKQYCMNELKDTQRKADGLLVNCKQALKTIVDKAATLHDGMDGRDGVDGKDGKDGEKGADGKDGSPDTPKEIKDKLVTLKGDDRLPATAIQGLDDIEDIRRMAKANGNDVRLGVSKTDIVNLQRQIDQRVVGVGTLKITVSSTAPTNPAVNDLWVDTA